VEGSENNKMDEIYELMEKENINELRTLMRKDVFKWQDYLSHERADLPLSDQEKQPNWSPGYRDSMYESVINDDC
jgi:hypothetical protein